jgi:hypothetical protein
MRRVIFIILLAAVGLFGYSKYEAHTRAAQAGEYKVPANNAGVHNGTVPVADAGFKCDGRTYCSQMTSCAEATYFLRNCPGVKMDGDGNGIPCERQWCSR